MNHRFTPIVLLLAAGFALPGSTSNSKAEESYTLRIASLAPAGSSWMKVLNAGDAKPAWDAAYTKVRDNFTGRLFPKSLLDAVATAAKP